MIAVWYALIGHRRGRILAHNLEQGDPKQRHPLTATARGVRRREDGRPKGHDEA